VACLREQATQSAADAARSDDADAHAFLRFGRIAHAGRQQCRDGRG
jgi:hypothetical protein